MTYVALPPECSARILPPGLLTRVTVPTDLPLPIPVQHALEDRRLRPRMPVSLGRRKKTNNLRHPQLHRSRSARRLERRRALVRSGCLVHRVRVGAFPNPEDSLLIQVTGRLTLFVITIAGLFFTRFLSVRRRFKHPTCARRTKKSAPGRTSFPGTLRVVVLLAFPWIPPAVRSRDPGPGIVYPRVVVMGWVRGKRSLSRLGKQTVKPHWANSQTRTRPSTQRGWGKTRNT